MGGKTNEKIFLVLLSISAVFFLNTCAPHKVPPERPSVTQGVKGVYHVVERHQTLYRICKTYRVDLKEVASLNRIADPSKIETGQRIFIPGAKKVLKVEIYIDDVVAEPAETAKTAYKKLDFIWPVEGKISNTFEEAESRRHQGIDISTPIGTPIKASNAGKVLYSNNGIRGYGNLIILRHSEEYVTVYAHNQVNLVEEGAWAEKGQIIGKVGQTGKATGPHLHFEIRKNNKALDPLLFLK
ncbi:MAG TPA: M23 family metallopeptidase [Thermodesulfobacteriota bacterium]|jgi:murein DD-endopeptidase MepM/ murein hydrolase activator NlpD|nr:M23 family metallopeptidase [Thermodesulfobacteriota bacterium]